MSASVTFSSGQTEQRFTVTATDDEVDEEDETVTLGFGTLPERVTPGTQSTAILTLTDNDTRAVTVSPTKLEVTEGGSESYTVVLRLAADRRRDGGGERCRRERSSRWRRRS